MKSFFVGVIFGFLIPILGAVGLANILDNDINPVVQTAKEAAQ